MKKPQELGTQDITKLLINYAIPSIIATTASALYHITDSIFIGHGVGALAISGLAITFPLMNLSAAFGSMVGVGASSLLSMKLGQKDYDSANKILGNVILLNVILGLSFTLAVVPFLRPILSFFGASKETMPYAYDFMLIIIMGNVITYLYFSLNAMIRASGQPIKSMTATILTVAINVVLNPLFIFVFKWGIRGSAFATVISQFLVLLWQIQVFNSNDSIFSITKSIFKLKKRIIIDSISIGLSPFLMNAVASVIVVIINQGLLKYGGDLAIGAFGIVNRLAMLFIMIVIGLNQGMQPIAGYNYGAKKYDRVIEVLKKSIFVATIITTSGFLLAELFPRQMVSIFTTDEELIQKSIYGIRIYFLLFPLIGFQMVASVFFQSIGKAIKAILLTLTRQVFFLIPCLLILPNFYQIKGVWISMPISDGSAVILSATLLYLQIKKFKSDDVVLSHN